MNIVLGFEFSVMGDTENTLPPSKKRAAGRELSKDNPGLDDEEEDVLGQEPGTFKKASEEVLANRRIVKVRRKAPSAPSSNPFASIQLIPPPTDSTPVTVPNVQETEKTASEVEEVESRDDAKKETGNEEEEGGNQQPEIQKEEAECDATKETESKNVETDEKNNSFGSFQHLSSSQNAFTGLVGTGFSSSSFSFGSITKGDNPTFPSITNGNSGIDKADGNSNKTPSMQEVQVETGEENEKAVFTADSVLFEFLDGGWKERGKGELKVNVSRTGIGKARLVMRARGNYRLILNASIFPDMKMTNMEKKGITFACLNSTGEGKDSLSTFALKFKDSSIVEEFRAMVTQHKGNSDAAVSSLKTPENSPKASDE